MPTARRSPRTARSRFRGRAVPARACLLLVPALAATLLAVNPVADFV